MDHVGKKIRQYRQLKGYTQQELADLIHKGRTLVSYIEKTGKVNHHTILLICKALSVSYEQLTSIAEEPFPVMENKIVDENRMLKAENERLKTELHLMSELVNSLKSHLKSVTQSKKQGK